MASPRWFATITLCVFVMAAVVCDTLDPDDQIDTGVPVTLQISLRNDSGRDVQILKSGVSPNPASVLAPTQTRELDLGYVKSGDVFRFNAFVFEESIGGAWLEVANAACVYNPTSSGDAIVSYRGGIALICENW